MSTMTFEDTLKNPEQVEFETMIDDKFGHLQGDERWHAIRDFGAQNIIDFSDLVDIGESRLFDDDERQDFDETLRIERLAKNDSAIFTGRDIYKLQGKFLKAAIKERTESGPAKPPETLIEFEAFLKAAGFSNRAAKKIAKEGFLSASV